VLKRHIKRNVWANPTCHCWSLGLTSSEKVACRFSGTVSVAAVVSTSTVFIKSTTKPTVIATAPTLDTIVQTFRAIR
jgi:hypothetical protein